MEKYYGLEKQLKKTAEMFPEYDFLWATWSLNKQTIDPILNAIIKDYPHYSLHDHTHSENIVQNIERLLGKNIELLSPTDLWLLLHTIYLHDFGMILLDERVYNIWGSVDFQNYLISLRDDIDDDLKRAANIILDFGMDSQIDNTWPIQIKKAITVLISSYCRSSHAEISKEYILDENNLWNIDFCHNGLVKRRFLILVAEICSIHTKSFSEIFNLPQKANGLKNDYVHPRLIASLLRMGDILDLDNGRFNKYGEKIFGTMPSNSQNHKGKHEATKHILINSDNIEVEADCPTDEIYRETRLWYDLLKNESDNLILSWNDIAPLEFGRPPKLSSCKILRNGVEDKDQLSNLKFMISQEKAFEIIEGASIYKDKFTCIREIIQNAEDASKIQLWRDIKSGIYFCPNGIDKEKVDNGNLSPNDIPSWIYQIYTIDVTVEKNDKNNAVLTVLDHGTGITINSLKQLCNVGESSSQHKVLKSEINDMPEWLRPTANFGVGLQSCFLVADNFSIFTCSNSDKSMKLSFETVKKCGYISVEKLPQDLMRGSQVIIEFNRNMNFSYNLLGYTAMSISEVEPFKSNCIVMYKLIEYLGVECSRSIFDIKVSSKELGFYDEIRSLFNNEERGNLKKVKNDCHYNLSENKASIVGWYKNNYFKLSLSKKSHASVKIYYKGKRVNNNNLRNSLKYIGFDISIDIFGIPTKDALTLNREELTYLASKKIELYIEEIINLYFEILSDEKENIEDKNLVDAYFLTSGIWKGIFPKSLTEKISEDSSLKILQRCESGDGNWCYKEKNISLKDLSEKYPNLSYIDYDIVDNIPFEVPQTTTIEKLLEELNKNIANIPEELDIIIVDRFLKEYLVRCNYDIMYIGEGLTDGLNDYSYLQVNKVTMSDDLYSPNGLMRAKLLKMLVYNSEQDCMTTDFIVRRKIPAFKEFEKLAVQCDKSFIGNGLKSKSKWSIISPISKDDLTVLKSSSKDCFVNYIRSLPVFNEIVDYVVNRSKIQGCSKEDIIREYVKLIEDYYDLVQN